MTRALHITGDDAADSLLSSDPLALMIGMLLDQQVQMETAFSGPAKIRDRVGSLDARTIAGLDADEFAAICKTPPAVHRFPGSMAGRIQALCASLVDDWDADAAAVWTRQRPDGSQPDGGEILSRLGRLPGFGEQKAKIFLALLGKQYGITAQGWREASAPYGEEGAHRSVADIVDGDSLDRVRETKRAAKAAAKGGA